MLKFTHTVSNSISVCIKKLHFKTHSNTTLCTYQSSHVFYRAMYGNAKRDIEIE